MLELETLDARGLLCPLPVIRTQDRIRHLAPGALLEVIARHRATVLFTAPTAFRAMLAVAGGLGLSMTEDTPAGPSIVVAAVMLFVLTHLAGRLLMRNATV